MVVVKRSKTWADSASAEDAAAHEHAEDSHESTERELEVIQTELKENITVKTKYVS
jgi:hypothetical protein